MRISFSVEEKTKPPSTIRIWNRNQLTQEMFRKLQVNYGIPAYLVETMFWHMEILHRLKPFSEFLVFKGGTCVQSYINPALQRASNDLDFNTIIQNPNALMQKIEDLNSELKTQEIAIEIQGIPYGFFEFESSDKTSGTLNYRHRMPSRFGEYEYAAGNDVQAKSIRVQINYKHAWLPAIKKVEKPVEFFIKGEAAPREPVVFPHSSIEDLIADKIMAIEEHTGRERSKDIYDLMILLDLNFDKDLVTKKLDLIARKTGRDAKELRSSANTVMAFGDRASEAQGFASMVCRGGKVLVKDWEIRCEKTAGKIIQLQV